MAAQDIRSILEGEVRILIGNSSRATIPDVLPADNVPIGGAWGGGWRELGFTTEDGVTFTFDRTYNDQMTAQSRTAVKSMRGATVERIACTILEITLDNFKDIAGYGVIQNTPAGVGTYGHRDLQFDPRTAIRYIAVGVEGIAPPDEDGMPRRIYMPLALATATGDMSQRIGQASTLPAQFNRQGNAVEGMTIIRDILKPL